MAGKTTETVCIHCGSVFEEHCREGMLRMNRLLAERQHLMGIKQYLREARDGLPMRSPEFALLIACEQMYVIHKRQLNKKLAKAGLGQVKR